MSFWSKLSKIIAPGDSSDFDTRSHWIYVRCKRCGDILSSCVDLQNDLSQDYASSQFVTRKTLVGDGANRCFQRVELTLTFDKNKRLLDIQAIGGEVVDPPQKEGEIGD